MSLHYLDDSTYLELLPPELQCQILKSIPNMKSLRALLRASSRYFQVYRASRKITLSYVAWNHISPSIVPIALNALWKRNRKNLQNHLIWSVTSQIKLKEPYEISLKTWEKLLHFHAIVENFISNFTRSRLVTLENFFHPQTNSSLPHESSSKRLSLSQVEYTRLARAFYNLDLYGSLFYDRESTFLQSLQDWELEELLCVRSFMIERLKDYLNKFDDDFMEVFLKDMPHIIWPPEKANLRISDVGLLSNQGRTRLHDIWIESRLTLGLGTLSAMFSTETLPGKFHVFKKRATSGNYMSLGLHDIPIPLEQVLEAKMKSPEIAFYDNIEQPNEAWFWTMRVNGHPRIYITDPCYGCDNHELECWGYVIWDHERLKRLRILTKSPSDIVASIGTDWRVKRSPMSLEERTRKQEEIWSREGRVSTFTKPRPMFDWESAFRSNHSLLGKDAIIWTSHTDRAVSCMR